MSIMMCCFCNYHIDTDYHSPDVYTFPVILPNDIKGERIEVSCGCEDGDDMSQRLTDLNIDHTFEPGD